jgi:cytochrome c-type biogenesis protein CcmF
MNHGFEAPLWGLRVGGCGRLAVCLGIAAFLLSAAMWLLPAPRRAAASAFWAGVVCVVAAIGAHLALLLGRQYEFDYVFRYTSNDTSWPYRLSGAWAGQEGSFLLWVATSAVIAGLAARRTGAYRRWYTVVCSCTLAAMLGIVAYESPFRYLQIDDVARASLPHVAGVFKPLDGRGLTPALQNYWMAIHPWVIFTGFGSLLALFGWSAAAAFSKDWKTWASAARPWAVFSATVLGLGLTMGGLWAYETLGWGGFWAWDPVENVSLVPFIGASVLVHTLYVSATRGRWTRWNLIVGAMPFVWFAYGTYLTRSGALATASVHSFAHMDDHAHRLLAALVGGAAAVALAVGAIALFARREPREVPEPGDRTAGMGWGMVALYVVGIFAAIGMSVPFLAATFHLHMPTTLGDPGKSIVSEAVYNQVVVWPFVPALLLMGVAPLLGWVKTAAGNWSRAAVILYVSFVVTAFPLVWIMLRTMRVGPWVMPAILLSVWACVASVASNVALFVQRRKSLASAGGFVTHAGVSILLLGLIVSHAFDQKGQATIDAQTPGRIEAGPLQYTVSMKHPLTGEQLVTPENRMDLVLKDDHGGQVDLRPTVFYRMSDDSEDPELVLRPAIKRSAFYDTYLSVTSRDTEMDPGPLNLGPGQTASVKIGGVVPAKLTYVAKKLTGGMGLPGSTFSVILRMEIGGQLFTISPEIELTDAGTMAHDDVAVGDDFGVRLEALQVGTGAATISFLYAQPVYSLELFFKPLTILVWIGAGLMTLGGAMTVIRLGRSRAT